MSALERFLSYITVDTNSNEDCEACPSSPNQLVLGQRLRDEMDEIGISDARQDENGYVYGFIPASEGCEDWPAIGFIAHMDTSSAVPGGPVHARIVRFDGNPIPLGNGLTLDNVPADLASKRLVVTDGSTLLGADNKAGVAEILTMAEALLAKGAGLGTVVSFMMSVTALSLPSMIMLAKAMKKKLLAAFILTVSAGIILIGYLFNAFSYLFI